MPKRPDDITSAEASEAIKRFAERQKIRIELTEEQVDDLLSKWDDKNPRQPAELTFYAKGREVIQVKVAGYRYRGDTCCV